MDTDLSRTIDTRRPLPGLREGLDLTLLGRDVSLPPLNLTPPTPPEPRPIWREAALCMVVAAIGFAVMNACAKEAAKSVPFLEIASVRSVVGLPLLGLYAHHRGLSLRVQNRPVAAVRVVAGTVAMGQTFYALSVIPMAEASALLNLTPLFVALLGVLWLRERVGWVVGMGLLLGLVGALLIFRPSSGHLGLGGAAALGASLTSAISMVTLRKLGQTETPEAVVFTFLTGSGIALGLLALPSWQLPTGREAALMAAAGLSATLGQLAMTRAYALDVAARVGGMNYLNILASLLLGAVVFGERPDRLALAGIAVILASGAVLVWTSRREQR